MDLDQLSLQQEPLRTPESSHLQVRAPKLCGCRDNLGPTETQQRLTCVSAWL